jgi:hypothetical protein
LAAGGKSDGEFRLRLRRKVSKVPGVFLNLSLNLNLAILKVRIAHRFLEINPFLI